LWGRNCGLLGFDLDSLEEGAVLAGVKFHPYHTVLAFVIVVIPEEAANFVRLYAHYRVLLRVEIRTSLIHFDANEVFVKLVLLAEKNLFAGKLEEAPSLWSLSKVLTFEDSLQFSALLIERQGVGFGRVV